MDLGYTWAALDRLTIEEASDIISKEIERREEARQERDEGLFDWDEYKE